MAQDVQSFDVRIVPGGSAAAPVLYSLTFAPRIVQQVEILIPDGVRGVVHFALAAAGTPIIPSNAGAYLSGNNEVIRWPLERYIDSGAWQLLAYNAGTFPHTLEIRFLLALVQSQQPAAPLLLSNAVLSSG